jgi:hypothetical protein
MTPRQVALVQRSWTLVQPIADKAAELFANTMQSNTAQGERIGAALKPILEA